MEGCRLTPAQRRIAHSMLRSPDDIPFLSSVAVAELAGVSQPSVTRFALAIGFDGYPALRRHLREIVTAGPELGPEPSPEQRPAAAPANVYQRLVQDEIDNLRDLSTALTDPGPVVRAARLLAASHPLPVLGLRAAAAQAVDFAHVARTAHADVRLLDEGGTALSNRIDDAVRAGASALLCFAVPRHPREVVGALVHARGAGLTVVTVTDSSFAPVAPHTDLLLPVGSANRFGTACAPVLLGRLLVRAARHGGTGAAEPSRRRRSPE
ncbi:MurR/RpiR family transcriptional regulator [Streptomyces sp. SID10853]|uniref:MurR/RpiR family transcriptional regulator n=1 Tax=Streptomyces sp. SID10853 TaxID=2706028 RepID=UPI0013BF2F14|nr:MurR/RpiR family transcriptional regulator [Streptomyces sp. SID10853]NDZ83147.1 MurR/RpiR family transcriptional regulator [Streptomyces sp. SID10853]